MWGKDMFKNTTNEERINLSNKMYPLYDGLSKDLLFYIAIDTLFLSVAKGFSAFQISFLGVVPTFICILMQPILLKSVKKLGNVNASRVGTFMLLLSAILKTFGATFLVISIAQVLYDGAFVFKSMESISLRNNLEYQNNSPAYMRIRGASNTIYATATFIIAIVAGPLFNISPYLPMYLCITFCLITCILSFSFYEVKINNLQDETEKKDKNKKNKKGKMSRIILMGLISNTIFLNVVVVGQQDSKLFIQYQLTDWYGITKTATYLSLIVASSRLVRIILNMAFNRYYIKFKNQVPIILSIILAIGFLSIILGAVLPLHNIIKVLLMALGFDLIIPMRDTFIIYMEDLMLKNTEKLEQQEVFANMEILRKLGKVSMNFLVSLLVIKLDLFYIMWIFLITAVIEVMLSKQIVKLAKI